jgi:mono/diheme cytochrome c family protein
VPIETLVDREISGESQDLPNGATVKWTSKNPVKVKQIQELAKRLANLGKGAAGFDAAVRSGNWREVNQMLVDGVRHGMFGNVNTAFKAPTPESIAKGKSLFLDHCSICHGADGTGSGIAAKDLSIKPANLLKAAANLTNQRFVMQIRFGAGDMPAWQDLLDEDDMLSITHYIRFMLAQGTKPSDLK